MKKVFLFALFLAVLLFESANAQSLGLSGLKAGMSKAQTLESLKAAGLPTSVTQRKWDSNIVDRVSSEIKVSPPDESLVVQMYFGQNDRLYAVQFFSFDRELRRYEIWRAFLKSSYSRTDEANEKNGKQVLSGCHDSKTEFKLVLTKDDLTTLTYYARPANDLPCKSNSSLSAATAYDTPELDRITANFGLANSGNLAQARNTPSLSQYTASYLKNDWAIDFSSDPERLAAEMLAAVDRIVSADSANWGFNRYKLGSISDVKINRSGETAVVEARYSYIGDRHGSVSLTFEGRKLACVVFWDSKDTCSPNSRSTRAGERTELGKRNDAERAEHENAVRQAMETTKFDPKSCLIQYQKEVRVDPPLRCTQYSVNPLGPSQCEAYETSSSYKEKRRFIQNKCNAPVKYYVFCSVADHYKYNLPPDVLSAGYEIEVGDGCVPAEQR